MSELNLLLIETEKALLHIKESLRIKNERYDKAIAILKRASKWSCCLCSDECLSCDIKQLLRELGEINGGE